MIDDSGLKKEAAGGAAGGDDESAALTLKADELELLGGDTRGASNPWDWWAALPTSATTGTPSGG